MTFVRQTFDWAGSFYEDLFYDFLHINFVVRTILLLFMSWLIVYVFTQTLRYFIFPIILLFYFHVILRVWNYLFIETVQEWLYLKYYSNDEPNYSPFYLRLCDKAKKNRMTLNHSKYSGMVIRAKRPTLQILIVFLTITTLWVFAFGIHQEYAVPVVLIPDSQNTNEFDNEYESNNEYNYDILEAYIPDVYYEYLQSDVAGINPTEWLPDSNITFVLTELGQQGARLRNGPGITNTTVLEMLWDDTFLTYLHVFVPDEFVRGLYWLRVSTPSGNVGYISSQLIE